MPGKSGIGIPGKSGIGMPGKSGIGMPGKSGMVMAGHTVNDPGMRQTSVQQQSHERSSQGQKHILLQSNGPMVSPGISGIVKPGTSVITNDGTSLITNAGTSGIVNAGTSGIANAGISGISKEGIVVLFHNPENRLNAVAVCVQMMVSGL